MNIFEELIDELKEENLLETTVTKTDNKEVSEKKFVSGEIIEAQTALENDNENYESNYVQPVVLDDIQTPAAEIKPLQSNKPSVTNADFFPNDDFSDFGQSDESDVDQIAFYRERATLEVSSLQIVEHIISGVEREQMKMVPKSYNDLAVKKSLHTFLQISQAQSGEHAQSEFQLMQETESWYSSLSHRDKHISVAHLRRYCENTRPALSTQALTALARFYRNSPYSESVRNKFDLVATRLFSREIGGDKRKTSLKRDEIISALRGLYAEWSSISLYSMDEEDSTLLLSAFKFEDFMTEADNAESFDELIRNDFFNRLRLFKESAGEQFFAPLVTAAAIESNVRIGNRYVDLLTVEREKGLAEKLENKYGFLHDQVISDATSKTLQLVELLKEKDFTELIKEKKAAKAAPVKIDKPIERKEKVNKQSANKNEIKKLEVISKPTDEEKLTSFSLNKVVLALTVLIIVASVGFYMKANNSPSSNIPTDVIKVNLENSSLKNFIKDGQVSNGVFLGTVESSWENLNIEKKQEILKKILSIGGNKGFSSVQLQNETKKTVGVAMQDKIELY